MGANPSLICELRLSVLKRKKNSHNIMHLGRLGENDYDKTPSRLKEEPNKHESSNTNSTSLTNQEQNYYVC